MANSREKVSNGWNGWKKNPSNSAVAVALVIVVFLLGVCALFHGINWMYNHGEKGNIVSEGYVSHSYTKGLGGHVEYTVYADGRTEIKEYPGFGHRLFDSVLYQDLDGDGEIDVIRENGPEWKYNSLQDIIIRKYRSGDEEKEKIQKADQLLSELRKKY